MKKIGPTPVLALIVLICGQILCSAERGAAQSNNTPGNSWAESARSAPHVMVRLEQELNTGKNRNHESFQVTTMERLITADRHTIPIGSKIVGHISRLESAGLTGRARVWLTFDDIETKRGSIPIVAEVSSVPGEYSVETRETAEGEIAAHAGNKSEVAEATAMGAAKGGAPGITSHNQKEAAMGAAMGGMAAFLASSGIGQEIDLPKGTKLDLVLDRPLNFPD